MRLTCACIHQYMSIAGTTRWKSCFRTTKGIEDSCSTIEAGANYEQHNEAPISERLQVLPERWLLIIQASDGRSQAQQQKESHWAEVGGLIQESCIAARPCSLRSTRIYVCTGMGDGISFTSTISCFPRNTYTIEVEGEAGVFIALRLS